MTRLLKLIAPATILMLVAFLLAGCGGDQAATPTLTKASTSKAKASGGTSTTEVENMIGQTVTPTDQSPQDFSDSIKKRRPVVVLFYMYGPYDDQQVRSSVTSLQSRYRGQVDFYIYANTEGERYKDLMQVLSVNTTPSTIVINRQATVQEAWTGYADSQSIEQGIVEATKS